MAESFVTPGDIKYFAKQLSKGNLVSPGDLQDYAGKIAGSVKDATKGITIFPPKPPTPFALGTIEVQFDGVHNKVLAPHQPSLEEETKENDDVVVIVPQPRPKKPVSILHSSPQSSATASPKRSKVFWKKNKNSAVAA